MLTYPYHQYLLSFHVLQEACPPSNTTYLLIAPQSLSVTLLGFIFFQRLITRLLGLCMYFFIVSLPLLSHKLHQSRDLIYLIQ